MEEKSKLFNRLGIQAGLKEVRRTHRGWLARIALPKIEKWDLAQFEKSLPRIRFNTIPVRQYGRVIEYV